MQIDEEKFFKCMKVNQLLMTPVTSRFEERFNELMKFDVPLSLSPEIKSISLQEILRDPRNIALAPTAAVLPEAIGDMYRGQFILALETAATGAGVTIIVLCTATLVYLVMNYLRGKAHKE